MFRVILQLLQQPTIKSKCLIVLIAFQAYNSNSQVSQLSMSQHSENASLAHIADLQYQFSGEFDIQQNSSEDVGQDQQQRSGERNNPEELQQEVERGAALLNSILHLQHQLLANNQQTRIVMDFSNCQNLMELAYFLSLLIHLIFTFQFEFLRGMYLGWYLIFGSCWKVVDSGNHIVSNVGLNEFFRNFCLYFMVFANLYYFFTDSHLDIFRYLFLMFYINYVVKALVSIPLASCGCVLIVSLCCTVLFNFHKEKKRKKQHKIKLQRFLKDNQLQNSGGGSSPDSFKSQQQGDQNLKECSICLNSLLDPQQPVKILRMPNCHHFFHKNCIEGWLKTGKNTCPLCRVIAIP